MTTLIYVSHWSNLIKYPIIFGLVQIAGMLWRWWTKGLANQQIQQQHVCIEPWRIQPRSRILRSKIMLQEKHHRRSVQTIDQIQSRRIERTIVIDPFEGDFRYISTQIPFIAIVTPILYVTPFYYKFIAQFIGLHGQTIGWGPEQFASHIGRHRWHHIHRDFRIADIVVLVLCRRWPRWSL